jgi:hypothetical protein
MEDPRVEKCLSAKRETKSVEFKQELQPGDPAQFLEILKDIIAIANSGGGTLAIGLDNSGNPSGKDVAGVLSYDHAKYCDLIRKYTNQNYCDFELVEARKNGWQLALFLINPPDFPLVFEKPGTYAVGKDQRTAFGGWPIRPDFGRVGLLTFTDNWPRPLTTARRPSPPKAGERW